MDLIIAIDVLYYRLPAGRSRLYNGHGLRRCYIDCEGTTYKRTRDEEEISAPPRSPGCVTEKLFRALNRYGH